MNCRDARASMPLLIDGLLEYEEEFAVRQHINGCRECQRIFAHFERDEQAINQYLRQAPYAPVARDVIARTERRRRPWWDAFRSGGNRLAGVVGLVLVVLVVGAGAWTLREMALSDTTETEPGQDVTVSSTEDEVAVDDPLLISGDDIGYILGKLEDAGLVFDTNARSESDEYTIEYQRIAFDRHFTLVEYRAEAEQPGTNAFVQVRGVPGGGGGQSVRFGDGVTEGWLVLAAVYPGSTEVLIEDYLSESVDSPLSHSLDVDLSALPYYNEGIERYDVADSNAGVTLCCLEIERGVAVSKVAWNWTIDDPDEVVAVDGTQQPGGAGVSSGMINPELHVEGDPIRILDSTFYRGVPLDGTSVAAYGLPATGELELEFAQVSLPEGGEDGGPLIAAGPWTLAVEMTQERETPDLDEYAIPPDVAQTPSPTPTPEPEVEMTPLPSDDDESEDRLRVLVYMVRGEEIGVSAREIPYTQQVATAAIRELFSGPNYADQDAGLHTEIPAGTELLNIALNGDTLTVDLSSDFTYGGGSASMMMRLAQVVHTATQFDSVSEVQILIEGEHVDAIGGEGILIDEPLDRHDFEDQAPAILIETPGPGETLGETVRLIGTANTFEATLQIEIIGPDGAELYKGHDMASSGTGTRGTFDLSIQIDLEADGWGAVRMFEYSARDGSAINVVEVPVRFERD